MNLTPAQHETADRLFREQGIDTAAVPERNGCVLTTTDGMTWDGLIHPDGVYEDDHRLLTLLYFASRKTGGLKANGA